jgi:hypothetical protein
VAIFPTMPDLLAPKNCHLTLSGVGVEKVLKPNGFSSASVPSSGFLFPFD